MQKKDVIVCIGVLFFVSSAYARDYNDLYIIARLGLQTNNAPKLQLDQLQNQPVKYRWYPSISAGIGKKLNKYFDLEINASRHEYNNKKSFSNNISNTSLHLGINYKIIDTIVIPYLMVGGGVSLNKISSMSVNSRSDYVEYSRLLPSYYAGVGLQYKCLDAVSLDISFKYTLLESVKSGINTRKNTMGGQVSPDRIKIKMNTQEILFGIQYNF
jgi:hypothetical protein